MRTSRDGVPGRSAGVLEDYACVAEGFCTLFAVTGNDEWLAFAGVLVDVILTHFADGTGGFFDTSDDAEQLIQRPREAADNATPSGWLAAAGVLITYAAYTGSQVHREAGVEALGVVSSLVDQSPRIAASGLSVVEALLDGPREIAIVGDPADPLARELHRVALMATNPGAVIAVADPRYESAVPLLQERGLTDGVATAYVCRDFVCQTPASTTVDLQHRLASR